MGDPEYFCSEILKEVLKSVIITVNSNQNIENDIESRTNHVVQDDLKSTSNQDIEIAQIPVIVDQDSKIVSIRNDFDKDDIENTSAHEKINDILFFNRKMEDSSNELENLQHIFKDLQLKISSHKNIIDDCKTKIMEANGDKLSQRDYLFGIVQRIFCIFLPTIYAIYGTILLNFMLSVSNAITDLSVFWLLFSQENTNKAYIVLGIDYFPGFLAVTHHLTESLNKQVPIIIVVFECLLLGVLYPLAVPLCYSIFIMARLRGQVLLEEKFHYLATMTTVIRTCFEDPFQLLLGIWLFSTRIIPPPWSSRTNFCDTLGNCLDLGSVVALVSFFISLISMMKGTLDGYQSDDYLGFGVYILTNMSFRIIIFSIIIMYLREWIIVLLVILFAISLIVNIKYRDTRSGINMLSSSFCSIYQPVIIPERPEIKQLTGKSSLDMKTVSNTSFWITILQLPVIFLAGIGTFFIVTRVDGFKQDFNIVFTADQLKFVTSYFMTPLFALSMISTIVLNCKGGKWLKIFLNLIVLLLTLSVFSLTLVSMPPTPQLLVLVNQQKGYSENRLEVAECFIFPNQLVDIPNMGLDGLCSGNACKCKEDKNELMKNERWTEGIITFTNKSEVFVFHPSNAKLEHYLHNSDCVNCRNLTNSCKYITQGLKKCTVGQCKYSPTFQNVNSTSGNPKIQKIKSDRCFVDDFLNAYLFKDKDFLKNPYNEGSKLEVQASCSEPFPYPSENQIKSCQNTSCTFVSNTTCLGDKWMIEDKCEKCNGTEYCKKRMMQDDQLASVCNSSTGSCICLKDSDCINESKSISKGILKEKEKLDCRFGGKCETRKCFPSFDGKNSIVVHKTGGQEIDIHLPHKTCSSNLGTAKYIVMAVMGGGGGSCKQDGCRGGNSGYILFRKIPILYFEKKEHFSLSIYVGEGGNKNGTSSTVSFPFWLPKIEARGGTSGTFCNDSICEKPPDSPDTFDPSGTFSPGGNSSEPMGNNLKITFPNSGPLIRVNDGDYGYKCNTVADDKGFADETCTGRGGGGGGLSIGADDERHVSQPNGGFGSGGANGNSGKSGVVVIWSDTIDVPVCHNIHRFRRAAGSILPVGASSMAPISSLCPLGTFSDNPLYCVTQSGQTCIVQWTIHGTVCPLGC